MFLHDLFLNSVSRFPNKLCIKYYDGNKYENFNYKQIEEKIILVSEEIKKRNGAIKCFVIFHLKDTKLTPVLILGCLISDCAFFYSDWDRSTIASLSEITKKLNAEWILTNDIDFEGDLFNWKNHGSVILFEEEIVFWKTDQEKELEADFAYAIQTSGTTGQPKIVKVPHACLLSNIIALKDLFGLNERDSILQSSPFTFDPSLIELFLGFACGASLCITSKPMKHNRTSLLKAIRSMNVSFIQTTPSLFRKWSKRELEVIFYEESSLRILVLGGEQFPDMDELESWRLYKNDKIKVFDIYGITEVSCWASCIQVWPSSFNIEQEKHIGDPLPNTKFKLLKVDSSEKDLIGELLIGSNERICVIEDENYEGLLKNKPIFRASGDIFQEIDGKFYFLRRKNESLFKRWGLNINCHNIEKISNSFSDSVQSQAVHVQVGSDIFLGLFVSISDKKFCNFITWMQKQKSKFDKGHWPDSIFHLDEFPVTEHGKIDKPHLCNLLEKEVDKINFLASNSKEEFEKLWVHMAGCSDVNNRSTFQECGGDSITALQLISLLKEAAQPKLLGLLLSNATFAECLECISSTETDSLKHKLGDDETKFHITLKKQRQTFEEVTMLLKGRRFTNLNGNPVQVRFNSDLHEIKVKWKYNMKKCIDASPLGIIFHSDNRELVIIGSHSGIVVVMCVKSGEIVSEIQLPNRVESSACVSLCTNYYYIGCYDGVMYSINMYKGDIKWRFYTNDMIKSTAIVNDGNIYFGSYDKFFYCLSEDGLLIWKTKLNSAILSAGIILENDIFVCGISGGVWSLNTEDGTINWTAETPPIFTNPLILNDPLDSSQKALLIAPVKENLIFIQPTSGIKVKTTPVQGHIFATPTLLNDSEFLMISDDTLHLIKNSHEVWTVKLDCRAVTTPLLLNDSSDKCLIPTTNGKFYSVDLMKRTINFMLDIGGDVFSTPVLFPSNCVIVGSRDDNMYCLELT